MKEFRFIIKDADGIHARPAGEFVKTAKQFESFIGIECRGKSADAKKIFAVMGLAAKQNDEVVVSAEGADEAQAVAALEMFMKENL